MEGHRLAEGRPGSDPGVPHPERSQVERGTVKDLTFHLQAKRAHDHSL